MQGIAAIFPYSRSITVGAENSGNFPEALVLTSEGSWGETDFTALEDQKLTYDEGADRPGPMTLAVAAENAETQSRLVVFGGSSFAQDSNFDFSGNGDMLVNSVDWVAEKEELIGFTERETTARTFNPPGSLQLILVVASAVCLIPLAVIGAGVYSWVMRRRRG
jgi:hypothetical protein